MEAFARHAGREVVRVEDVMLLARRNEGLKRILEEERRSVEGEGKEKEGEESGRGKGKGKGK